jgi:hypothetical protein
VNDTHACIRERDDNTLLAHKATIAGFAVGELNCFASFNQLGKHANDACDVISYTNNIPWVFV